jgi:hypothetical protein
MKAAFLVLLLAISQARIDIDLHPLHTPEEYAAMIKSYKVRSFLESSPSIVIDDTENLSYYGAI